MRHRKRRTKMSMRGSQRKATLRNMVKGLLRYQKIQTTMRRAKEARRLAEHLITLSKSDNSASRRRAYSILTDRDLVTKLFKEISLLFKARQSGFTRIIPLGFRRGDGATLAILELTEKRTVEKKPKKKKEKTAAAEEGPKEAPRVKPEKAAGAKLEEGKKEVKKEPRKEEPKVMTIPKSKPTLEEEKKTSKAKTAEKKIEGKKNFLKNLRGFFRRKTDM